MTNDLIPTPPSSSLQTLDKPPLCAPQTVARESRRQMAESLRGLLALAKAHHTDPAPPPLDLEPLTAHLSDLTTQTQAALNAGARMPLEENLVTQARMLDAVFQKLIHGMAQRSLRDDTLRTALNAQRQYRYTVESLRKAPKNTPNELNNA